MALQELYKMRLKMIFRDKEGLVSYALDLYREMAYFNYQNLLKRYFDNRILRLALEKYREFVDANREMQRQLIEDMKLSKKHERPRISVVDTTATHFAIATNKTESSMILPPRPSPPHSGYAIS